MFKVTKHIDSATAPAAQLRWPMPAPHGHNGRVEVDVESAQLDARAWSWISRTSNAR